MNGDLIRQKINSCKEKNSETVVKVVRKRAASEGSKNEPVSRSVTLVRNPKRREISFRALVCCDVWTIILNRLMESKKGYLHCIALTRTSSLLYSSIGKFADSLLGPCNEIFLADRFDLLRWPEKDAIPMWLALDLPKALFLYMLLPNWGNGFNYKKEFENRLVDLISLWQDSDFSFSIVNENGGEIAYIGHIIYGLHCGGFSLVLNPKNPQEGWLLSRFLESYFLKNLIDVKNKPKMTLNKEFFQLIDCLAVCQRWNNISRLLNYLVGDLCHILQNTLLGKEAIALKIINYLIKTGLISGALEEKLIDVLLNEISIRRNTGSFEEVLINCVKANLNHLNKVVFKLCDPDNELQEREWYWLIEFAKSNLISKEWAAKFMPRIISELNNLKFQDKCFEFLQILSDGNESCLEVIPKNLIMEKLTNFDPDSRHITSLLNILSCHAQAHLISDQEAKELLPLLIKLAEYKGNPFYILSYFIRYKLISVDHIQLMNIAKKALNVVDDSDPEKKPAALWLLINLVNGEFINSKEVVMSIENWENRFSTFSYIFQIDQSQLESQWNSEIMLELMSLLIPTINIDPLKLRAYEFCGDENRLIHAASLYLEKGIADELISSAWAKQFLDFAIEFTSSEDNFQMTGISYYFVLLVQNNLLNIKQIVSLMFNDPRDVVKLQGGLFFMGKFTEAKLVSKDFAQEQLPYLISMLSHLKCSGDALYVLRLFLSNDLIGSSDVQKYLPHIGEMICNPELHIKKNSISCLLAIANEKLISNAQGEKLWAIIASECKNNINIFSYTMHVEIVMLLELFIENELISEPVASSQWALFISMMRYFSIPYPRVSSLLDVYIQYNLISIESVEKELPNIIEMINDATTKENAIDVKTGFRFLSKLVCAQLIPELNMNKLCLLAVKNLGNSPRLATEDVLEFLNKVINSRLNAPLNLDGAELWSLIIPMFNDTSINEDCIQKVLSSLFKAKIISEAILKKKLPLICYGGNIQRGVDALFDKLEKESTISPEFAKEIQESLDLDFRYSPEERQLHFLRECFSMAGSLNLYVWMLLLVYFLFQEDPNNNWQS